MLPNWKPEASTFTGTRAALPWRRAGISRRRGQPIMRRSFLESNRGSHCGIYRQVPGQDTAEAIVTGSENAWSPVVSPDEHWILYLVYPAVRGSDTPVQLMRV